MCGIAGIAWTKNSSLNTQSARPIVDAMTARIAHRGPDGAGTWDDDNVALGHRRLSIIDLSGGAQPMSSESGAVITFNGEIYNFVELRDDLKSKGTRFKTDSDTEVILALYDRHGPGCVDYLNGMFAFAIWDPKRRQLVLARDRMGKKPLYFRHSNGVLSFGSELKTLSLLSPHQPALSVDPRSISDYLSFGYILDPKTIFQGVTSLPAGSIAVYQTDSDRLDYSTYWDPADIYGGPTRPYDDKARQTFQELFHDAVRIRLRADVPIGAFLSGGVDSSSIAATIDKNLESPPKLFSVGFAEASFDESGFAQDVANHLSLPLEVLSASPIGAMQLPELVWHLDEPFADTSMLPMWELSEAAQRQVSVALSGDGADEILAGYVTYKADRYYDILRRFPKPLISCASWLAASLLRPSYKKVSWDYKVRQFLAAAGMSREDAHLSWRTIFTAAEKARLMSPELIEACGDYDPIAEARQHFDRVRGGSFLNQTLYVDLKTWLQNDILVKIDRMSMAHSLELRSPFLDYRLVEFMAGLDDKAKMNGGVHKTILKDVMRDVLPASCLSRRKQGFGAPVMDGRRIDTSGLGPMFNKNFHLDPLREDVTYKSFALQVLAAWVGIFERYESDGNWAVDQ